MSRRDRENWQAQLDADPALQAAWNGFQGTLARLVPPLLAAPDRPIEDVERDLSELREAAQRVHEGAGKP